LAAAVFSAAACAQEGRGDVIYVPTPQVVVDEMLKMAKVGPGDYVIDLGSGDGRIVITAAKKFGARGFGVDLDPVLLKLSNENAQREGVADRARFIEENLFRTDLSQATVITSYLLPEMNEKLRPKILNLKPGTRVVTHDYHMGEWHAEEMRTLDVPEKKVGNPGKSYVYRYTVPAKIAGRWQSQIAAGAQPANWEFEFAQRFQMFDGVAMSGGRKITLRVPKLEGDQLSFQFFTRHGDNSTRHEFKGTVKGELIDGTLRLGAGAAQKQVPWSAKLVKRAASPE
ncbi:MAG: class I SAM-dependent methyltransferase, partial [Betaproteobacteria bacterium]|nr:class I SAM-dependent methyltransferase [Betaproteobacteria bacterium]